MTDTQEKRAALAALRREIAEELGYKVRHVLHWKVYQLLLNDTPIAIKRNSQFDGIADAFEFWLTAGTIPNWPTVLEDAWALCEQIADRLGARGVTVLYPEYDGFDYTALFLGPQKSADWRYREMYGDTPAEALSKLALKALRAVGRGE